MTFNTQLRIPGPTPLPERVVRSMSRPMIDHRGPEFAAILGEITAGAKRIFKTKHDLLLLTSSATGGLESAVANLVSPGADGVAARNGPCQRQRARMGAAGEGTLTTLLLRLEGGEDLGGEGHDAVHARDPGRLRHAGRLAYAGGGRPEQCLRAPRAARPGDSG